jgi:hypothetical protein
MFNWDACERETLAYLNALYRDFLDRERDIRNALWPNTVNRDFLYIRWNANRKNTLSAGRRCFPAVIISVRYRFLLPARPLFWERLCVRPPSGSGFLQNLPFGLGFWNTFVLQWLRTEGLSGAVRISEFFFSCLVKNLVLLSLLWVWSRVCLLLYKADVCSGKVILYIRDVRVRALLLKKWVHIFWLLFFRFL